MALVACHVPATGLAVHADHPERPTRRHNNYLGKILNANVYDVAVETPLQPASSLSAATGNHVLIKREDLQVGRHRALLRSRMHGRGRARARAPPCGSAGGACAQPVYSFKIRGAYNKIASLTAEQLRAGIVACSAGNHAQGVALSASRLGVDAAIIMPLATPRIKVDGVRKLGGESATVVLHGMTYDEAQAEAMRRVEEEGRTLIHPFDDPLVIAGQVTLPLADMPYAALCIRTFCVGSTAVQRRRTLIYPIYMGAGYDRR